MLLRLMEFCIKKKKKSDTIYTIIMILRGKPPHQLWRSKTTRSYTSNLTILLREREKKTLILIHVV